MGREIRRVPPNWQHPKDDNGDYIPLYDYDYETKASEWLNNLHLWEAGNHPKQQRVEKFAKFYWEWETPPDEDTCRPKFDAEPTWYQMYETVSEGTPVTPPFATPEELVDYLVSNGDYSDQRYENGGWNRKAAEQFVKAGYAPSLIGFGSKETGYILHAPRDGAIELDEEMPR